MLLFVSIIIVVILRVEMITQEICRLGINMVTGLTEAFTAMVLAVILFMTLLQYVCDA